MIQRREDSATGFWYLDNLCTAESVDVIQASRLGWSLVVYDRVFAYISETNYNFLEDFFGLILYYFFTLI